MNRQLFNSMIAQYRLINSEVGEAMSINDISSIPHAINTKVSAPDGVDVSTIQVVKQGANVLDGNLRIEPKTEYGLTTQYLPEEDCYLFNGTAESTRGYYNLPTVVKTDGFITNTIEYVSGSITIPDGGLARYYVGGSNTNDGTSANWIDTHIEYNDVKSSQSSRSFKYIARTWFYISAGVVFDNYKIRVQTQIGNTPSPYERHITPITYPANADGSVNGVSAIYPITTLSTDTDGAVIESSYIA